MWDPRGRELVFDKCVVVPGAVLRIMGEPSKCRSLW